ncbi:unnamed protein product [Ranitomeya imitator]|uniref:Peptidase S1 domain-containing protein n=1 Tax=Ranitomeya imitator TaxID=111125 RepID=A0ABN9LLY4_9NEOB|nr:unnamed protein product [Ranitomeya imitator]
MDATCGDTSQCVANESLWRKTHPAGNFAGCVFTPKRRIAIVSDLLQLEKPAMLNEFVALLPLPKSKENITTGKICSVAGWGITDFKKKSSSDVLLEVMLAIVDNEICEEKYKKIKQRIIDSMICAKAPNKNHKADTCAGDSGGPLICDGKYVGLVSFGPKECGASDLPGVYTRLTDNYLKWIQNTIWRDYSEM